MITLEQFRGFKKKKPKGYLFAIDGDFGIVAFFPTAYVVRHFEDGTEKHLIEGVSAHQEFAEPTDFFTRDVFFNSMQAANELGARLANVTYELKDPKEEEE